MRDFFSQISTRIRMINSDRYIRLQHICLKDGSPRKNFEEVFQWLNLRQQGTHLKLF